MRRCAGSSCCPPSGFDFSQAKPRGACRNCDLDMGLGGLAGLAGFSDLAEGFDSGHPGFGISHLIGFR